ncbi:MAG: hypothetical protein PHG74_07905 [Kiritimatiellae bacterium]|jgi:hypothetical protein|nr:hypothetical protein [Kiritimatiellia bacterium]MDD3583925.1 hypothetical protein [Kiritimatiellia bacterium]HON47402.1 hypothetical protein [Kiritimatiellia bacterium]
MISFDRAQTYFGAENHHKAAVWSAFGQAHRTGAIAAARRVLSRGLGRSMDENEPAYKEGDRTRDEYAVYEQALWMLENGQVADADGNDPVPVLTGRPDTEDVRSTSASVYAPEALRWLGMTGGAVIRG